MATLIGILHGMTLHRSSPRGSVGVFKAALFIIVSLILSTGCQLISQAPVIDRWEPISSAIPLATVQKMSGNIFSDMQAEDHLWTHQAVWTGHAMFVWGDGGAALYYPNTDTWTTVVLKGGPSPRGDALLAWTGSRVIVWNGYYKEGLVGGGQYDPTTHSWQAISTIGAPDVTSLATSVWTGKEFIVWATTTGYAYDPAKDSWRTLPLNGEPSMRTGQSMVWTGKQVIVWGGDSSPGTNNELPRPLNDGARYDPSTNTWTPVSVDGAPAPRADQFAVWDGTEMLVFGGIYQWEATRPPAALSYNDGVRYNPTSDTWTPLPATNLLPRLGFLPSSLAIWTGHDVVIWGDYWTLPPISYFGGQSIVAARFRPQTNSWSALSGDGAPVHGVGYCAVWTGKEVIVLGWARAQGQDPNAVTWKFSGAKYIP